MAKVIAKTSLSKAIAKNALISAQSCSDGQVLNTDGDVVASVPSGGSAVVSDSNIQNSNASYSVNLPATDSLILPDTNIFNSGAYSQDIPSTESFFLLDSTKVDSDGSISTIETTPGGTVICTPESLQIYAEFADGDDQNTINSLPADFAGTYTTFSTQTGSVGTLTVSVNGGSFAALPFTAASGDSIIFQVSLSSGLRIIVIE